MYTRMPRKQDVFWGLWLDSNINYTVTILREYILVNMY